MKNILWHAVRLFLAVNFIFAGAVKLADPVGTQYKMEEYFQVLGLDFLTPYALYFALFLVVLEWTLGWWLLLGYRLRQTLKVLTALTVFFLFLTGFSAVTGKVTDCGCFGEALKLTPWQTFWKNIIYLVLLFFLMRTAPRAPSRSPKFLRMAAYTLPVLALFLAVRAVRHLPLKEFTPYAVGKNIREGMASEDDYVFEEVWYYKVNGEVRRFSTSEAPWRIPGAEFVKHETVTVSEGRPPEIAGFYIDSERGDITDEVLSAPSAWLILLVHPDRLTDEDYKRLTRILQYFKEQKAKYYVITSADTPKLERWSRAMDTPLNWMDHTVLKTMLRARAGVMHLENATVTGKWTIQDFLKHTGK
ncbi:MAG: hypothetical protein GXO27_02545 [Chlorobi bacterium]|nr:hypothetical protein [Chlorobiota bacterium]